MAVAQLLLFDDPDDPGPDRLGRANVRQIDVKSILAKPTGSLASFDYSLNPYVGCGFACSYCYASFFQADPERFESWGTWVEIKRNAVELLRSKRDLKGKRIYMSSATDPYQPLERKVELTRRLVEVMSEPLRQPRLVIQTRGPLITRDIDLLTHFEDIRVNMSITTDSDDVRKRFEPSCASIEQRLEAVRMLSEVGIFVSISVMPMLPIEDVQGFAKRIRDSGAQGMWAGYFHESERAAFAANTRPDAWRIARETGWTEERYRRTKEELKAALPESWHVR